jgi:hypothetical protein
MLKVKVFLVLLVHGRVIQLIFWKTFFNIDVNIDMMYSRRSTQINAVMNPILRITFQWIKAKLDANVVISPIPQEDSQPWLVVPCAK